jgi:hypothetical protein
MPPPPTCPLNYFTVPINFCLQKINLDLLREESLSNHDYGFLNSGCRKPALFEEYVAAGNTTECSEEVTVHLTMMYNTQNYWVF